MKDKRYFYMKDIDCTLVVEYATRKELLDLIDEYAECVEKYAEMLESGNPNAEFYNPSEEVFMILYKDGTIDYIDEDYDGHHIRRFNIASIVECNSSTYMVYGNFEMSENGVASPAFEDAIDESLKEVDSEDYTESATEQAAEQEQQPTTEATEPEAEQETAQEEATTESGNQDNAETDTYEHALKMAMYAAEYGDGVQAIFHKDGKFKAGLEADREYAEKNGWQYFHTVWETVPEEERMKQQKHDREHTAEECIRIISKECNPNPKAHTALQEGLKPTKVFCKGEWRVLVLFLPIKGGHDFADRCEIRALPENSYEDIATSLEKGKHGFSEWLLYDPETTSKRLKHYQEAAMKKFTEKTGIQV